MNYLLIAVLMLVSGIIGAGVGAFFIYRNNKCKTLQILEVIDKGTFSIDSAKKIEQILKGECKTNGDCKDCK